MVQKAYEARQEIDQQEGRLGSRLLGTFFSRHDAEEMAQGHGVMGSTGPVVEILVVRGTDEQLYKLAEATPVMVHADVTQALRERALSKLTPAERKALGV